MPRGVPATIDDVGTTAVASRSARAALLAAVLGFFIVTFDAVVVNVALPSIRTDLGGGIAGLQWVVDGYTLMFAALLLAAGAFSDRRGARRAFIIGVVGFVAASAACGLAPGLGLLVAARFVQGSAAAVMMPASMALIGQAYPEARSRARAVAIWAMGGAIASSSAPVLGGVLTVVSWRLIFLINIPVGVVAIALAIRTKPSPTREVSFDTVGFVAAVAAMGGLTFGAIEAGEHGFTAPVVIAAFAVAALASAAFIVRQRNAAHPMVPLDLFRRRNVTVTIAVGFAFVVGYYGLPFVMSLYLQQTRHLSAFQTGLVFLPMMLIGAALTPSSARIAERFGSTPSRRHRTRPDERRPHRPGHDHGDRHANHRRRADASRRARRPIDHATGHRRAAQQRPRRHRWNRQRGVQHEPATRRRSRHRCLRGAARPTRRSRPRTPPQPPDRSRRRRSRRLHRPTPHHPRHRQRGATVRPDLAAQPHRIEHRVTTTTTTQLAALATASEIDITTPQRRHAPPSNHDLGRRPLTSAVCGRALPV